MSKPPTQQAVDIDEIQNPKFNSASLDFLLIELVPLVQRVTERVQAREQALLDEYRRSRILNQHAGDSKDNTEEAGTAVDGEVEKTGDTTGDPSQDTNRPMNSLGFPAVAPTTQEAMAHRLDKMGYRVGQGLVERFSANTPRPQTPLDIIKFLCKDLWLVCFRKQIDNLKTNHRGVFVLTDNRFHPLSRMSVDRRAPAKAREESLARAHMVCLRRLTLATYPGG